MATIAKVLKAEIARTADFGLAVVARFKIA